MNTISKDGGLMQELILTRSGIEENKRLYLKKKGIVMSQCLLAIYVVLS